MTADVELLPLYAELQGHPKLEIIKHYARANVAHATAPLQAEIEALRAEVELLKKGIVPRDDDLIVPVKLLDEINASGAEWKDRAEQLAEALSHQRWCRTCAEDGWESCEDGRKADALLRPTAAQENDDA